MVGMWLYRMNVNFGSLPDRVETSELVRGPGLAHSPALSEDGRVLAYAWDGGQNGAMGIWAKLPGEPGESPLTDRSFDSTEPSISPDGTRVVFRSEKERGGIYIKSILGGTERKLADDGHDPQFSPDGQRIAYWTGLNGNHRFATGRIYVILANGGSPVRVAENFSDARWPTWSPDGKWLLFLGTRPGRSPEVASAWYVVETLTETIAQTDLSERLKSANLVLYECPIKWANGRLYFAAYHGESSNLWSAPIRPGGHPEIGSISQITSGPAIELEPQALANGTVVFSTMTSNVNVWSSRLDRIGTDTQKQLTSTSFTVSSQPSSSRNGEYLVFIRKEGNSRSIYLREMSSGQETRIFQGRAFRPVVSPDGTRIAFSEKDDSKEPIWVYNRLTAVTEKICEDCGMVLDWMPDMSSLAYSKGSRPGIYLLDPSTKGYSKLLESSNEVLFDELRFSPDGGHVAFIKQLANSRREIIIAPFQGGTVGDEQTWMHLTTGSRWDNNPRWLPDGRGLVFLSHRDLFGCIWRVRLDRSYKAISDPEPIQHLHAANRSALELSDLSFQLTVGGNQIFYNLAELSSTIWAAQSRGR